MGNAIFDAIGDNIPQNDMLRQFTEFRNQMKGKNPRDEINKLLQSGAISQQQLNQAQQMAHQMQNMFNVH